MKRTLAGNINRVTGELDTDAAAKAILTHRNTPSQSTGVAPSVALFGTALRDHLPNHFRNLRKEWQDIYTAREQALAKRHIVSAPTRPMMGRSLRPLKVGGDVAIQDQSGYKPRKWQNTGTIVESLPHRQYRVIVDGSRRVTLRNRRFLKQIHPLCRRSIYPEGAPAEERPVINPPQPTSTPPPSDQQPPLHQSTTAPEPAASPRTQEGGVRSDAHLEGDSRT
jgi:hypothetical protein